MPINVRYDGDLVILSNFARLLNDPRHFDAARDVRALLDEGRRKFAFDLRGLKDIGSTCLGLLTTLTRLIRQHEGEAVLAEVGPEAIGLLDQMRLDSYWEIFESVGEAKAYFDRLAGA